MPCEVCVSERAYGQMADDVDECRRDVADIRQQRDECAGAREQLKRVIAQHRADLDAERLRAAELRREVSRLQREQTDPWQWAALGGCAASAVSGGMLWAFGREVEGLVLAGSAVGLCVVGWWL